MLCWPPCLLPARRGCISLLSFSNADCKLCSYACHFSTLLPRLVRMMQAQQAQQSQFYEAGAVQLPCARPRHSPLAESCNSCTDENDRERVSGREFSGHESSRDGEAAEGAHNPVLSRAMVQTKCSAITLKLPCCAQSGYYQSNQPERFKDGYRPPGAQKLLSRQLFHGCYSCLHPYIH